MQVQHQLCRLRAAVLLLVFAVNRQQAAAFSISNSVKHVSSIGGCSPRSPSPVTGVKWGLMMTQSDSGAPSETAALPPSSDSSDDNNKNNLETEMLSAASNSASVATMISQESKRALIEDLGYRRQDVERLKFDLALSLIEKQVRCPEEGMPTSWCRSEEELAFEKSAMMQKLEQESKYPLKLPLLGISLVLFGKGFGDALVTLIKVNIDFPGASLTEEFMGVPVLLIDAVCTVVGASLAWWTWKTMK